MKAFEIESIEAPKEIAGILRAVIAEYEQAASEHAAWHSAHEGYAVLLEEVDELWDEVRRKRTLRDPDQMRREATQIASCAIRFVKDVVGSHPRSMLGDDLQPVRAR